MEEIEINLTTVGGYHFGKLINMNNLSGSYFEENNSNNKATIISIIYNPDNIYIKNDGYTGNCWTAIMKNNNETSIHKLNFRNTNDLFAYYEAQNMKFINNLNLYEKF